MESTGSARTSPADVHAGRRPSVTDRRAPAKWTPRSVVRRAGEILRSEGGRTLWFKILGETVYRRMTLIEIPLAPPPAVRDPGAALSFRFLTDEEIPAYLRLRPDLARDEVERRLARGDRCWVADAAGELVSGRWLGTGSARIDYLGRDLALEPGEVFVYESYTAPAYRGRGASAAAGTRMARVLAGEGYRRIVAAVVPENRTAFRAFRKTGYREIGRMGYLRLGPWRREFVRRWA